MHKTGAAAETHRCPGPFFAEWRGPGRQEGDASEAIAHMLPADPTLGADAWGRRVGPARGNAAAFRNERIHRDPARPGRVPP
jgi:hypothetical protein